MVVRGRGGEWAEGMVVSGREGLVVRGMVMCE